MAAKRETLKKRLIRDGIIAVVALGALLAGAALVSNYADDAQSEKRLKQNEISSLRNSIDAMQLQLGAGLERSTFYELYARNHNPSLTLDRKTVTDALTRLREKYHLVNLSVTIAPITDVAGEPVDLKTGVLARSQVDLAFGAPSDTAVYGLLGELERELPGFMVVTDLKLGRAAELSRAVLMDLSQHKIDPLITAQVIFVWLGVRPKVPPAGAEAIHAP